MRRGARPIIKQRRRIFLGCEGESERSYGVRLHHLVELRHRRIHIDAVLLQPGGGDPLAIVQRALDQMRDRTRKRGAYRAKAVLLDSDKLGQKPDRDTQAFALAKQNGMLLILQDSCHEALILRHLEDCSALRPPSTKHAWDELTRRWPEYRKNMPALALAARIDRTAVLRAAAAEANLRAFLVMIEFGED